MLVVQRALPQVQTVLHLRTQQQQGQVQRQGTDTLNGVGRGWDLSEFEISKVWISQGTTPAIGGPIPVWKGVVQEVAGADAKDKVSTAQEEKESCEEGKTRTCTENLPSTESVAGRSWCRDPDGSFDRVACRRGFASAYPPVSTLPGWGIFHAHKCIFMQADRQTQKRRHTHTQEEKI
mgnify:CR=1 FL=1